MKRTGFLKRKTPLRQTRRAGPDTEREPKPMAKASVQPLHRGTYSGGTSGKAVQKECASQHAGYMQAVRGLGYCMNCGRACRPQFCHADQGKGAGLKTDVRSGWPGCGPGDWGPGCHWLIGTSGTYSKEQRRSIEARLAHKTREAVKAAGTWPKSLAFVDGEK